MTITASTTGPDTGVRPPFMLHTLTAQPGTMGSPAQPAVELVQREDDGHVLSSHQLRPDQARALADQLIAAANLAERGWR